MIKKLIKSLQEMAANVICRDSVWMLLCEFSYRVAVDPTCAAKKWPTLDLDAAESRVPTYVSRILANTCEKLDTSQRKTLKEKLKDEISHYR